MDMTALNARLELRKERRLRARILEQLNPKEKGTKEAKTS